MPRPVDFAAIFELSPNPYMLLDRELRYVAANAAYLRVTSMERADLLGRQVFDVFPHDPADPGNASATRLRESFERVLATGRMDVLALIPYRVPRRRDGAIVLEERYWSATHTPVLDEDGQVAFILQHTVDVTEQKELEGERHAAREELERRAEYEQQLIGIVSHDLRNPLAAVAMAASLLLRRGNLDEQQSRAIARIVSSTDRAARLIRDFMDFAQSRSPGSIPIAPTQADLRDITRQVVDELRLAHPGRATLVEHVDEATGQWDADRIAQVIGNLVVNAFQHGAREAPVRITVRSDDDQVVIAVHNEGPPIPPEDITRLFEPFQRGRSAHSSNGRGIGLGLHISRAIIGAHGGTIEVASAPGDGTTFTIRLPRRAGMRARVA